ncbi:MAG TPA: hypothetical protein VIS96_08265 [Terrimicrobiaceae bacterium]
MIPLISDGEASIRGDQRDHPEALKDTGETGITRMINGLSGNNVVIWKSWCLA